MIDMDKIANFISELRRSKTLTQSDLAKELHITPQAVSKWETGLSLPDTVALLKLADYFGITTDEILRGVLKTEINGSTIKRKDLEPSSNNEERISVGKTYEDVVVINGNGKKIEYHLNNEGITDTQKTSKKFQVTKDSKEFYYNYDTQNKEDEEDDVLSIHQLIGMAPFLSQKSLAKLINRVKEKNYPIDQILALAPFLSEEKIEEISELMIQSNNLDKFEALLPFIPMEKLELIIDNQNSLKTDINFILKAAPFLSENTIIKFISNSDGKISLDKLCSLAPFINEVKIGEMVIDNFCNENIELIANLLPFLSETTMDQLIIMVEKENISKDFISSSLPFMSKKAIGNIIENNYISNNLETLANLAPFLDSEQLDRILFNIKKGTIPKKAFTIIAPFLGEEHLDRLVDENI
ncbi:MAG: helix-turn-helix transcriptional regulator [Candidatus Delongbacteria bacterium]|nr:helix-turn-helix transcriptional regulator [Candidatus Delongbacteria bacterium]MBN2835039.1 helix-turn-helix transcriptional regulator [Candidatus Delongbacteria bacterium]